MAALRDFKILDELGQGQFSTVYRAKWMNAPPSAGPSPTTPGFTDPFGQQPQQPMTTHGYYPMAGPTISSNPDLIANHYHQPVSGGPAQRQPPALPTRSTTTTSERLVALKRIKFCDIQDASARGDYLKEVQLLQQVKHPNIINFNISFVERNELFIVLELADGGDLSKLIRYFQKKKRLMPEHMILKYFVQVCSAVAYIHSKRILHRDIKPANIFMTSDGCVKLGDFGLGRFFSQNTRDAHSIVGTFYYMSPERIKETGYSFSSDVWSLGCVLYELITLSSPFSILNYEQNLAAQQQNTNPYNLQWLINRIIAAEYPSLEAYANISLRLRRLTEECLTPTQEERPDMPYICSVVNDIRASIEQQQQHQQRHHQ